MYITTPKIVLREKEMKQENSSKTLSARFNQDSRIYKMVY